ncbi:MAG: hypothetical protein AB7V50_05405 [Vampirovibrionia bacterium]
MTENTFSIQNKILSHKLKAQKLKAQKELYSNGSYFNQAKVDDLDNSINNESLNIQYYEGVLSQKKSEDKEDKRESLDELETKAYAGDIDALEKLIEYASKNNSQYGQLAKQICVDLANTGDETYAKFLVDAFGKDGAVLSALVKGNSNYAIEASEKLADLPSASLINGQITGNYMTTDVTETMFENLCKDADRNIHRIAKFANTERGAQKLAEVATSQPTSYAGRIATASLGKAFVNNSGKVANIALKGLIDAGSAGNTEAVKTLNKIAKSPVVSENKAMLAIDALAKIAESGSQTGSDSTATGMGALTDIAKDKDVSPKIRSHAIKHLGKLISNGQDPQMGATDALIDLAMNSESPMVSETARKEVFKAAEKNPEVLDRGVDLFYSVARGNKKATNKVKKQAVDLLGKAAENNGPNAGKAVESLAVLTKNHDKIVA